MSSRRDLPSDPGTPESGGPPIDTSRRYDVYCCDKDQRLVVFRDALFKGVKTLYRRSKFDPWGEFIELEQSNGQSVFLHRHTVVRFCEPGTQLTMEFVSPQ